MARYGRVALSISYVVDLDDAEMVDDARQLIVEDVAGVLRREIESWIDIEQDDKATREDIHDILIEWQEERRRSDREHHGALCLPPDVATSVQAIIDGDAGDCGRDECVFDREVVFDDGCQMAVQAVVNNERDGGWTQGVLFSQNGGELGCTEPGDSLTGEYRVHVERDDGTHLYVVSVETAVVAS